MRDRSSIMLSPNERQIVDALRARLRLRSFGATIRWCVAQSVKQLHPDLWEAYLAAEAEEGDDG